MKKKPLFPKVRWIYEDLSRFNEKKQLFVKIRSTFLWQFYFRFVKSGYGWFTPCNCCQRIINGLWCDYVRHFDFNPTIVERALSRLCKVCKQKVKMKLYETDISFDNTKMEIELSRSWVKSDKDEDCIEISFNEWKENLEI